MKTASILLNIDSAGLWNTTGRMDVVPKKDYFFPMLVQNLPQIFSYWAEVTVKAAACNSKYSRFGLNSHLTVIIAVRLGVLWLAIQSVQSVLHSFYYLRAHLCYGSY